LDLSNIFIGKPLNLHLSLLSEKHNYSEQPHDDLLLRIISFQKLKKEKLYIDRSKLSLSYSGNNL